MKQPASIAAACLAAAISICFLLQAGVSVAADDDHSYLPPWMRAAPGAVQKDQQTSSPPPTAPAGRAAKEEVLPAKTAAPDSGALLAKAAQVQKRIVGFVSDLF